ncbi:ribose 5-phosphate isomerase B [bacterium]|nr:ribose 5-phosphate isomerase B [bacterium]
MTNIVKSVALGSDHRGFELKKQLKQFLIMKGFEVADLGTDSPETCDYPDFAYLVAHAVVSDKAQRGIMIDSRGLASAMVANKVKGSRAAVCNDISSALSSRAHNDSNILALGAEVITTEQAKGILEVWLKTPFEGGRYQKRLDKISKIEQST